jgi:hypothetical protein
MQNFDYLRIYRPNYQKRRLGKNNDGGYIICDMDGDYDIFLSGGIDKDVSFEFDFLKLFPDIVCHAFDGSIDQLPDQGVVLVPGDDQWVPIADSENNWIQIGNLYCKFGTKHLETFGCPVWGDNHEYAGVRRYIGVMNPTLQLLPNPDTLTWTEAREKYSNLVSSFDIDMSRRMCFHRKYLGKHNNDNTSNLREYFDKYQNIFMKLDIEGGENTLFETLSDDDLKKIKQLVIEFHSHDQVKIPSRLMKTHWLVHLHVNNFVSTVTKKGNVVLPEIFECTYVRKLDDESLPFNTDPIPSPLDQPNVPGQPDIMLMGYPYTDTCNFPGSIQPELTHGLTSILSEIKSLNRINQEILNLLKVLIKKIE